MSEEISTRNPLRRDGTSQSQRFPAALEENYFKIDERSAEDFLLFAYRYSELINYYDADNQIDGDWKAFFEKDISIVIARVAKNEYQEYKTSYEGLLETLETTTNQANFKPLFEQIIQIGLLLDSWLLVLPEDNGLRARIAATIDSDLSTALVKLIAIDKGAVALSAGTAIGADYSNFSKNWFKEGVDYASIPANTSAYKGFNETQRISRASTLVGSIFETFYNALKVIVQTAPDYLEESFSYAYHEPHLALFIAFIQLFKNLQTHINTLTQRHLDHYYKEVLQFVEKAEVPDKAHVVFELGKSFEDFKIPEGTRLEAGQDSSGEDLFYTTNREIIVNKTSIDSLRTIHAKATPLVIEALDVDGTSVQTTIQKVQKIYAAPVANSRDGEGEPIDDTEPKWPVLGEDQALLGNASRTMIDADMGFAITSPMFLLREGKRIMRMALKVNNQEAHNFTDLSDREIARIEVELRNNLKPTYTGEEGWETTRISKLAWITNSSRLSSYHSGFSGLFPGAEEFTNHQALAIEIELTGEAPACVNYDPTIHGAGYTTNFPIVRFNFDNQGAFFDEVNRLLDPAMDPKLFDFYALSFSNGYGAGAIVLYEGNIYKAKTATSSTDGTFSTATWDRFDSIEDFIESLRTDTYVQGITWLNDYTYNFAYRPGWVWPGGTIQPPDRVFYQGKIFEAVKNSTSPAPFDGSEFWEFADDITSVNPSEYDPDAFYLIGDTVTYNGEVYQAKTYSRSPAPDEDPSYWRELVDLNTNVYKYLDNLEVTDLRLTVDVTGMTNLVLQNDFGILDPSKSIQPFTSRPTPGSNFYVGSQEVFSKDLVSLDLHIKWSNLPDEDLKTYYTEYPAAGHVSFGNSSFKVVPYFLEGSEWNNTTGATLNLFNNASGAPAANQTLAIGVVDQGVRDPHLGNFKRFDRNLKKGVIRLVLQSSSTLSADFTFGHQQHPNLLAQTLGEHDPTSTSTLTLPNDPYTPIISEISLDYSSFQAVELSVSKEDHYTNRVEQFLSIQPFGLREMHPYLLNSTEKVGPVPPLEEGQLYIGLKDLQPVQTISMLFQLAEGSGNPDLVKPDINWHQLYKNQWQEVANTSFITDTTNGLLTSGIVAIEVSDLASSDNTVLNSGLHWIRASVSSNVAAVNKAIGIQPQAVTVTYTNQGNDASHLNAPLVAGSITDLENKEPAIKSVNQPYSSFGGRPQEQGQQFYTRVSERLKHKNRAVTIFDYERLVLEQFPGIYKVKCLNHTFLDENDASTYSEIEPGHVMVVTIPDLKNQNAVNPFEPRTSLNQLDEIKAFLNSYVSPFVNLTVKNPLYETLRVSLDVGFVDGLDNGFYRLQLNEDIKRYLSPWAFDEGEDILFGGKIHWSVILNFIEERPYVEFVNNFRLDHLVDDSTTLENVEEAEASTARSILVSAEEHIINPLSDGNFKCVSQNAGVNHWVVEENFRVL